MSRHRRRLRSCMEPIAPESQLPCYGCRGLAGAVRNINQGSAVLAATRRNGPWPAPAKPGLVTQPGEADQSPTSNIHPAGFHALMLNTLDATTVTGYSSTHTRSSLTAPTPTGRAGDRGNGDAPRLTVASQERRLRIGWTGAATLRGETFVAALPQRGTSDTAYGPRHLAAPLLGSYQALLAAPVLVPATMTSGNGFIRRIIRAGSGPAMQWSDDELDVYAGVLRDPRRATASSQCYRSFLTRELPAGFVGGHSPNDFDVPALLVMGEDSQIRRVLDPQPSRNLRVEPVTAAGHFLPEEAPERVIELTLEPLAEAWLRVRRAG